MIVVAVPLKTATRAGVVTRARASEVSTGVFDTDVRARLR
jgi:hypothetical protein